MGGDTVATVGTQRVSQGDFEQAIKQQQETLTAQFGRNFDPALMDSPEMRKSVLDRVISERLVGLGAERAGVRIGDKQLAERIAAEPAFQEDGKFSKSRYDAIARAQGYTAVGLDERLREDMRTSRYRDAIMQTAIVPRSTLDGFIRLSEQSREVSVINVAPEAFAAAVKPTEEQLKAYYTANAKEFAVPEQVRVEYVELSLDALAAKTPADPEDVKKFYESNKARFVTREERRASHILLTVKPDASDAERKAAEARAAALVEELKKKPASFAELAKKESKDPGSAAQGGDLGFFPRGAMVKPFEDAAFAAKKDEIIGPVLSEFGYHVIRVTDIKPEKGKSVAEAAPEIEAELKKGAAARRFPDVAEGLTNMVYEQSTSLKPASDQYSLAIQQSGWFAKIGGAPPVLANPKLLAEIFSDNAIKAKRNTAAIEVAPGVIVAARVVEHKPAEQRPFETVKAVDRAARPARGNHEARHGRRRGEAQGRGRGQGGRPQVAGTPRGEPPEARRALAPGARQGLPRRRQETARRRRRSDAGRLFAREGHQGDRGGQDRRGEAQGAVRTPQADRGGERARIRACQPARPHRRRGEEGRPREEGRALTYQVHVPGTCTWYLSPRRAPRWWC